MQLAISRTISKSTAIAMPNYTPDGWWECDLWAVTKRGYSVEYEIKTTLADFRADAGKSTQRFDRYDRRERRFLYTDVVKHEEIAAGRGPTRFFFAVPYALIDAVTPELPEWAGLVATSRNVSWTYGIWIVKDAPRLHNRKAGTREVRLAQHRACFRYWTELERSERVRAETARQAAEGGQGDG